MLEKTLHYRFELLSFFVLLLTVTSVYNFDWGADFWEHATIVRSFSQNLYSIQNPIINNTDIHAFQTPYHWLLGLLTYITGLDSFLVLRFAGIFNIFVLLRSFSFLTKSIFPFENIKSVQFYSLFLLLFAMSSPWNWSGFLDLNTLLVSSCYPSVLANAFFLLSIAFWIKFQKKERIILNFFLTVISLSFILLIHSLTVVSAFTIILSTIILTVLKKDKTKYFSIIAALLIVFCTVLLTSLYPFFDITKLIGNKSLTLHNLSFYIYRVAPTNTFPVLFILLILCFSIRDLKNDKTIFQVFLIGISLLLIIFLYGYMTSKYSYGRVISQICILTQILGGFILAKVENEIKNKKYKLFLSAFLILFILTDNHLIKGTISIIKPKDATNFQYNQFSFLKKYVGKDDIVLSDAASNFIIPAFTGKVVYSNFLVVSLHQQKDYLQRENDVTEFFKKTTTDSIRLQMLERNSVNYILLKKQDVEAEVSHFCTHYSISIYSDNLWDLYKTK